MIEDVNTEESGPAQAARRGADLLDVNFPGWENDIDIDLLCMGSPCRCVGGQVGLIRRIPGGFNGFITHLGLIGDDDEYLGFEETPNAPYNDLRIAWIHEIELRKNGSSGHD